MNQEQFNHYLDTCERVEVTDDDDDYDDYDDDDYDDYDDDDYSSYYDESSEEENPSPQWNIPNWQGNSPDVVGTVCPCIKQVMDDGSIRGCTKCDEYCDMPSLVGDADQTQCEGCYLLANGLGGENQLSHSCMEHF